MRKLSYHCSDLRVHAVVPLWMDITRVCRCVSAALYSHVTMLSCTSFSNSSVRMLSYTSCSHSTHLSECSPVCLTLDSPFIMISCMSCTRLTRQYALLYVSHSTHRSECSPVCLTLHSPVRMLSCMSNTPLTYQNALLYV